jgi:translation initiation factor IF-3
MRISRKKKPEKPLIPHYAINEQVKVPEVRLIDEEGNNLGVISTKDALEKALGAASDLVVINPKAEPPIAKIVQFSHFKYQKEKEMRKQKFNSHVSELKGIRLSIRIGAHDLDMRRDQTEKFLNRGDKVKIEVQLRGRDRAQSQMAYEIIKKFTDQIKNNMSIRFEQESVWQGNGVAAIIIKQ